MIHTFAKDVLIQSNIKMHFASSAALQTTVSDMYKMFTRDAGKYFVEIILYASNPPNVNNGMRTTLQIVRLTRKDGLFSSAKCSHRIFASLILSCMVFQVFNHLLNFLAVQKLRRYSRITSTVKVTSNDKKIMVNIRFVEVPLVTWRGVT